jgi:Methyltransferase domain
VRWAPIEYLECPASAITAHDDSFDVVLCQHGRQFFQERAAAAREMRRVARPGGTEPFPRAFDPDSYRSSAARAAPGVRPSPADPPRQPVRARGEADVHERTNPSGIPSR